MDGIKFLKPAHKNLIVRDPVSKNALSEKGENKPWTGKEGIYWRRRVKDGSAIIFEKTKEIKKSFAKEEVSKPVEQTVKNKGGKL